MKSARGHSDSAQLMHEEYLTRLGKRNHYLKDLNRDKAKEKLAEKEKNFSAYVNGANAAKPRTKRKPSSNQCNDDVARQASSLSYHSLSKKFQINENRTQSAPSSEGRRKYWGQKPIMIKTKSGEDLHLAQDDMEMSYSDSFASDDDDECKVSYSPSLDDSNGYVSEDPDLVEAINTSLHIERQDAKSLAKSNFEKPSKSYHTDLSDCATVDTAKREVKILLFSNWHETDNLIGLTEIQLFDEKNKEVQLCHEDISISNAEIVDGSLSNIINGVMKTVKPRNMLLLQPISVPIEIKVQAKAKKLSKLKLCNYNEQSERLNFGVKFSKVFVNKKLVFEGNIDKGCGNKIFDYCFNINLQNSEKPMRKSNALASPRAKLACNFNPNVQNTITSTTKPKALDRKTKMEANLDVGNKEDCLPFITPSKMKHSPKKAGFDKSMNSLLRFNSSHLGRLEASIDLENDFFAKHLKNFDAAKTPPSDNFEIPILPEGSRLTFNIRSTWGDFHYAGLNGIEIFDAKGNPVDISEITADPSDINILDDHNSDPRIVSNLIDGHYCTKDDFRTWLIPFSEGKNHFIFMKFAKQSRIAMIRIWNYNKSRIHSFRGVKDLEISLDDELIFRSQIAKASGTPLDMKNFGDTILFTTDDQILEKISENDKTFMPDGDNATECVVLTDRPKTGRRRSAHSRHSNHGNAEVEISHVNEYNLDSFENRNILCVKSIILKFLANWGDESEIGLTGIELLGEDDQPIPISSESLSINANMQNDLPKVVNSVNITTDATNMVLFPFDSEFELSLEINCLQARQMKGIRIWNYNTNLEDSYKGVKIMDVILDGRAISPSQGVLLRKAPGHTEYDFAQDVLFVPERSVQGRNNVSPLPYSVSTSSMPTGFVFQIQILKSISDPYYVGLNGLQIFDERGQQIDLSDNNIAAFPESINILNNVDDDARTPDKLIDGVNDTFDPQHMWLSPIIPNVICKIFIIFDIPVTVSMIKIWNYAKTPSRGVRDFAVVVDELLVCSGILHPAPSSSHKKMEPDLITFTADEDILNRAGKCKVVSDLNESDQQDIRMTNNHQIMSSKPTEIPNQNLRPMTTVRRDQRTQLRSRY